MRDDISAALTEAGLDQTRIDEVLATLDPVGTRLTAVDERVQGAVAEIDRLDDGAQQVSAGAATVATGAATLATGTATAADGAAQVQGGAAALDGGMTQLEDGATRLRDGLADGAAAVALVRRRRPSGAGRHAGGSGRDRADVAHAAQNYGAGLAPFFAALAGWIGIYALFLIVKPVSKRAVTALHSPIRITLAGWATPAILGGLQMVGLFGVLALALGFSFAHPLATLGILVLASATYAAIVLALNVWLGSVGQFLGLVLMVLQLVTAGGTFPWQTLPAPLAALHHVLPMGYVVDAMRQVMYGGNADRVWLDLAVLLAWLVGAGLVAAIGVTRMTHFRTLRDLQPSSSADPQPHRCDKRPVARRKANTIRHNPRVGVSMRSGACATRTHQGPDPAVPGTASLPHPRSESPSMPKPQPSPYAVDDTAPRRSAGRTVGITLFSIVAGVVVLALIAVGFVAFTRSARSRSSAARWRCRASTHR